MGMTPTGQGHRHSTTPCRVGGTLQRLTQEEAGDRGGALRGPGSWVAVSRGCGPTDSLPALTGSPEGEAQEGQISLFQTLRVTEGLSPPPSSTEASHTSGQ